MRQRYAYGSNIAAVRCGWDVKIKEQWRIKDSNLQSGAVLWLRHSFARAFYWGFFVRDSVPVDCFAYARNDKNSACKKNNVMLSVSVASLCFCFRIDSAQAECRPRFRQGARAR